MTSSNQLKMTPRTIQKVVPPSTPFVPYSQGRSELAQAESTVEILTHHGIPGVKIFTVFPEAELGVTFFVSSGGRSGWMCEDFEANLQEVPMFAQQTLVAAVQIGVPMVDIRLAKAVSVIPPSLSDVIKEDISLTITGINRVIDRCQVKFQDWRVQRQRQLAERRAVEDQARRQLAERRAVENEVQRLPMIYDPDPALIVRIGSEGYWVELARWE